uniref:Metallo-beta-lactamase domain-containing protein n=1 Tax=Cafeteria roenbergensis TaxID=33653 RepID=A0A7S0JZJ6_CAFRO|mmetsp:Transcript_21588/g.82156  ORF Transcript_21588/g.82156 Transcript_21588/m.82156 type:complete len:450 (+) Transcript_21588:117-1466(+)
MAASGAACLLPVDHQPAALTIEACGLTICVRSVAGVHTATAFPKDGIRACFDMGLAHGRTLGCSATFVTHGHMDHIAALAHHAGLRSMARLPPSAVFAPAAIAAELSSAVAALAAVSGPSPAGEVLPVECGDVVWLHSKRVPALQAGAGLRADALPDDAALRQGGERASAVGAAAASTPASAAAESGAGAGAAAAAAAAEREAAMRALVRGRSALEGRRGLCVMPIPTVHRVASQGYLIARAGKQLREDLQQAGPEAIKAASAAGETVTQPTLEILAAVTGDTIAAGMLAQPAFRCAPVLVTECTLTGPDMGPEVAAERGHTHVADLAEAWARRQLTGRVLVLTHLSTREGPAGHCALVRAALEEALSARGVALRGWRVDGGGDAKFAAGSAFAGDVPGVDGEYAPGADTWPPRACGAAVGILCADCDDDEAAGWRRPAVVCAAHAHQL